LKSSFPDGLFLFWEHSMVLSTHTRKWMLGLGACMLASSLSLAAQGGAPQDADHKHRQEKWPQATLRAEASEEVARDTVKITLAAEISDATQVAVAKALTAALDSVMKQAKGTPNVKATTGNYHVWPMNDQNGKISNWRGRGEILLESRDFGAASELAAALSDRMPIAGIFFSVSPEVRAEKEAALLTRAAKAFQTRAQEVATAFGFAGYSIRTVDLSGAGAEYQPAPRMMSMAADKAGVPLEGGTERVTVSMRGSIFLR
jgi:predicted secreted protein